MMENSSVAHAASKASKFTLTNAYVQSDVSEEGVLLDNLMKCVLLAVEVSDKAPSDAEKIQEQYFAA